MKVGIDVDGVLANFNLGFAHVLADVTGERNIYQDAEVEPSVWNWPLDIATEVEVERAWERVKTSRTWWAGLRQVRDIGQSLLMAENMGLDGHEVYFITSRPGVYAQVQTAQWIGQHSFIQYPAVLVCDLKPLAARALRLDALIDDYPPNLADLPQGCRGLLVDRPWNASWRLGRGIERVENCDAALESLL